jgi:hypothetical protein
MALAQSFVRAEVRRGASPGLKLKGADAFTAYAIASTKDLIPEMESAARLTLNHPMTFKVLGEGLRLFEGWALRDLVKFRRRCGDNLVTCLDSFLTPGLGPSKIWIGCPAVMATRVSIHPFPQIPVLPKWFTELFSRTQNVLKREMFTSPITGNIYFGLRREYLIALRDHTHCDFCSGVHKKNSSTFCAVLKSKLTQARNRVLHSFTFQVPRTEIHLSRYADRGSRFVRLISTLGNH